MKEISFVGPASRFVASPVSPEADSCLTVILFSNKCPQTTSGTQAGIENLHLPLPACPVAGRHFCCMLDCIVVK